MRGGKSHGHQRISGRAHGRGVAAPAHARAIPSDAAARYRAPRELRAKLREARGPLRLRRLRPAAVRIEDEVRERHRLAEFQRPGAGRGRNLDRSQLRHGTHGGALQPLRKPSRPRVRGRAAADAPALLHQRRRHEFPARADVVNRRSPPFIPAQAEIQGPLPWLLGPGFRGDERRETREGHYALTQSPTRPSNIPRAFSRMRSNRARSASPMPSVSFPAFTVPPTPMSRVPQTTYI